MVDVSKSGVNLEAGSYKLQGYSTTGERRQVSIVPSATVFPSSFAHLKYSPKMRTHTRPNSASNINAGVRTSRDNTWTLISRCNTTCSREGMEEDGGEKDRQDATAMRT